MNNNNTTYKDSPLGKIPSDWEVKLLSELAVLISGLHLNPDDYNHAGEGLPYFTGPTDYTNEISLITKWTTKKSALANRGDILITVKGSGVGSLHQLELKHLSIGRQIMALRANENCSNKFIHYSLYNLEYNFKELAKGNMIPGLTRTDILTSKVLTPPLPEQKAIAHVLGLIDSVINTNNQLIAQKELQKKWLMQNLLTGKKRLMGFGLVWENYKLEYFIEDYDEKPKDGIRYEILTSAKSGLMKQTDYYGDNRITNREDADYNVIPPNYLTYRSRSDDGLFTFNKNTLGFIGLISGYYPVFTINNNGDLNFILMFCNFYRDKFKKYCIGTSQLVLSMNAYKSANFSIPEREEQTAIAKVLQAADKEIQLLKAKTEKLREQKKGLMQVLLTGKKRLTISNRCCFK